MDNDGVVSTPAVTAGDRLDKLMTRNIPNLQLHGFGPLLRRADLPFHTDGADVAFGVRVSDAALS